MQPSSLDAPATPARIRALAAAGLLDERIYARGQAAIGRRATAASWRRFLDVQALLLGAVLCVAGVVCFVAANWGAIPPLARMGGVAAAIAGSAALGLLMGLDRLPGRAAILVAGLLMGPLLAIYGQTYQTGADDWELFRAWAALIVPFAAVARFDGLWIFWIALVDAAALLFWDQVVGQPIYGPGGSGIVLALAGFHAAAVAGWEWARAGGAPWARGRLLPRTVAAVGLAGLTWPVLALVADGARDGWQAATPLALAVALAALFGLYRLRIPDLFMLAIAAASTATVATTAIARVLFEGRGELGAVFVLGAIILGETAAVGLWLRGWHRHPAHRGTEV